MAYEPKEGTASLWPPSGKGDYRRGKAKIDGKLVDLMIVAETRNGKQCFDVFAKCGAVFLREPKGENPPAIGGDVVVGQPPRQMDVLGWKNTTEQGRSYTKLVIKEKDAPPPEESGGDDPPPGGDDIPF